MAHPDDHAHKQRDHDLVLTFGLKPPKPGSIPTWTGCQFNRPGFDRTGWRGGNSRGEELIPGIRTFPRPGSIMPPLRWKPKDSAGYYLPHPDHAHRAQREFGVAISPDQIGEGIPAQTVDYTIVITNTSKGLTDTFSLEMSSSLWQTWLETISVGPIAAGVSQEVPMHVLANCNSTLPAEVDQVVITAKSPEQPPQNGCCIVQDHRSCAMLLADLELGKTVFPDPGWAGQPLTYTLTVTNHGPTIAPETMLVDILSPKLEYLCDDAGCSLAGGVLTCPLGTLPVDVVRTVKIRALPMHTGLLVNQAAVGLPGG